MLPFKLVYHERYDLNLGAHVFPSEKFRLTHDKLLSDGIASPDDILRPEPATDADIRRVHGEGFCAIHDVAVAIRTLQARKEIARALVVDTDVHHGNGTAAIFSKDDSVFTLSIHQLNNYPAHKPRSSLDLNLEDGVADKEYLATLFPAV